MSVSAFVCFIFTFCRSRIRRSQGAVSDSVAKDSNLCILFIIIDDFPLEHVWRLWLKNASDELHKVDVFFHAKHPDRVRSSWVRDRLVEQFHYSPSWGSVDIAKVMLFMLKEVNNNHSFCLVGSLLGCRFLKSVLMSISLYLPLNLVFRYKPWRQL